MPDILEDFSSYENTADMLADPRELYVPSEEINTGRMVLDQTVGFGGSTKSLRYDYPALGSSCNDYVISRALRLGSSAPTEVWVEAIVRFDANFRTSAGTSACGAGYKFLFVTIAPEVGGRFALHFENGDNGNVDAEGPNDNYDAFFLRTNAHPISLFDGSWHVVRYHVRLQGAADFHETWIDGSYKGNRTANTGATSLPWVILARNMNQGPLQATSIWWGRVAIYTTNPGW